jgi:hypothetical protein
VGVGDPLEATYPLVGPIHGGNWHLVGDGVILSPVDMQFDVLWRTSTGDQPIVRFSHHFDPPTGAQAYDAVPLDADATGAAFAATSGDLLVLRMTAVQASPGPAYIPNADGPHTSGRIPSLTLPP